MATTELVSELKRWCRGEGLDETYALMTIVPEEVEIHEVEETLETIKSLGRVRVRGRNFINGHCCDALFDSGSQVTIIFESWYQTYLSDVPIRPVSGLALWGLSESEGSYPYRGYVVVDVEYPAKVAGADQTVTILALICPQPRTADQTPVIVGTNASHIRRLVQQCKDNGIDITQTLGIQCYRDNNPASTITATALEEKDDVGCVLWQGPGPLTLPPGGDCSAVCKVEYKHQVDKQILMVDSSPLTSLPAGVLLQPMVVPSEDVNVSHFRILVQNESLTETVIPAGTVIGHMYLTDAVTHLSPSKTADTELDPNLINFGDSPLVRMPTLEVEDKSHVKTRTRAETQKRSKKVLPEVQKVLQEMQESMDSSSDVEYYGPEKPYSTYLKEILEKERDTAGQSNLIQDDGDSSQQSDGNPAEDSLSEDESVEEEHNSVREEDGDQDSEEESDPESDNPCHDKHPETVTKTKVISKPENRPKRIVKPVIRLTYDEPGRGKDQPLTIVHRGVVIKIGKS
ncbi:hypothetical protein N1851_024723 [Merluccius polli]|uniref:Peptidase A2 domain-containing protein n=1 Tax=Merluccius polli TaxID=89951 RepID=A0AA47MES4_MERPO|nr:hypothetical protein N1851_024723 [Merluccius polli]